MERNTDRKTLNFTKGMTRTPSDLACGDDELALCDGFVNRDGEMKPLRPPVAVGKTAHEIRFVHKGADFKNLITYDRENEEIVAYRYDGRNLTDGQSLPTRTEPKDIQAVGNILIAATESGLHYYRWQEGKYVDMGEDLPDPICIIVSTPAKESFERGVLCRLTEFYNHGTWYGEYDPATGELVKISEVYNSGDNVKRQYHNYSINLERKTDFEAAVNGCVEAVLKKLKEKNRFCFPFFVRYALKMYDGTYAKISNPILCVPSKNNFKFVPVEQDGDGGIKGETSAQADYFLYMPQSVELEVTADTENLEAWSDLIEGITVFATDEVRPIAAEQEWDFVLGTDSMRLEYATFATEDSKEYRWTTDNVARAVLWPTKNKTEEEIINDLKEKALFYRLTDIKTGETTGKIGSNVVSTLTEQERLDVDDYYGWTKKTAEKLYAYNGRLNLMNVGRRPWKGFGEHVTKCHVSTGQAVYCHYYTHIVSDTMDGWVKTSGWTEIGLAGSWLYYPDPNAKEMIVAIMNDASDPQGAENGIRVELRKHNRLNGAYYFGRLPAYEEAPKVEPQSIPALSLAPTERMDSQILTSVVNNPFVFEASGDNTVGTGRILGVVANVEPVSQGQFGQYPLLVFTTEGIYAMSVADDGLFSSIHPISRETCVEDSPLVQTGRLVFFVSRKGLMATSGGATQCVSERMEGGSGRWQTAASVCTMQDFLERSVIAYDYTEDMLVIGSHDESFSYVYDMRGGTFSIGYKDKTYMRTAGDYPDCLIQDAEGTIYSFAGRTDEDNDKEMYGGTLLTRPLKLGGSTMLKSLRRIIHLADTDEGNVRLGLYGSNDCRNWTKVGSLGGKPWKYFVMEYKLDGFKATDRFAGSVAEIQTRRYDKMR